MRTDDAHMPLAEPTDSPAAAAIHAPAQVVVSETALRRFLRRFWANRVSMLALVVLLLLTFAAVAAPLIAPYAPGDIDVVNRLSSPTTAHWLGTDSLGRDTFSRIIYAGRASLFAALFAVAVAAVLGVPTALIAGYFGGWVDWLLGRTADVLMTFPALILAVALIAATGPGLLKAMSAIGLVYAPRLFRVVRSATLAVRAETYIEASVSIGTPAWNIILRRVLPNILSPLLVQISLLLASALLAEASLSLLGLGVIPPTPSWGNMLGRGFTEIRSTPGLVFWPGLVIAIATLSFNLFGDGLRDALGREVRKGD